MLFKPVQIIKGYYFQGRTRAKSLVSAVITMMPQGAAHRPLTSCIGPAGRHSQLWMNKITVASIILAIQLIVSHSSLMKLMQDIRTIVDYSCEVETTSTQALNESTKIAATVATGLMVAAIDKTVSTSVVVFNDMLVGFEELIMFVLELWLGTYTCLLLATVYGAVSAATNATEAIISYVDDGLSDIETILEKGLTELTDVISEAEGEYSSLFSILGIKSTSFSSLNSTIVKLKEFSIPSSVNSTLIALETSIPTFDEIKNDTKTVISDTLSSVFLDIKTVNESSFGSLLKSQVEDIVLSSNNTGSNSSCSTLTSNIFWNEVTSRLSKAFGGLIALCFIIAVGACFVISLQETKAYRQMKNIQVKSSEEMAEMTQNFLCYRFKLWLTSSIQDDIQREHWQWFISYILHPNMRFFFMIGASVLIGGILQLVLFSEVKSVVTKGSHFLESEHTSVNATESLTSWTRNTNDKILALQNDVNEELFGNVKNATAVFNSTINTLSDDIEQAISYAFGNSSLESILSSVVQCVIGNKLDTIQKALKWINDNSELTLDTIPSNWSGLENDLTTSTAIRRVYSVTQSLIDGYHDSIKKQILVGGLLLCVWLLQGVSALMYMVYSLTKLNRDLEKPITSMHVELPIITHNVFATPPMSSSPIGAPPPPPIPPAYFGNTNIKAYRAELSRNSYSDVRSDKAFREP